MTAEVSKSGTTRRVFLWQSFLALNTLYLYPAFGEGGSNSAALSLKIYDAETGKLMPCSVALRTSTGELSRRALVTVMVSVARESSSLPFQPGRPGSL
jgi:hypothetical protein